MNYKRAFIIILISIFLFPVFITSQYETPEKSRLKNKCLPKLPKKIQSMSQNRIAGYFNKLGLKFYKRQKIVGARDMFYCATLFNDKHTLAHYNYACMLSLLTRNKPVCEILDLLGKIEGHLRHSIRLSSKRKKRIRVDQDFDPVRKYPFFKKLLIKSHWKIRKILIFMKHWYGPKPGVYPHSPQLEFHPNGRVIVKSFQFEPSPGFKSQIFQYRVFKNGKIIIKNQKTKKIEYRGRIKINKKDGMVHSILIDFGKHLFLTPTPDYCSA